MNMFCHHSTCHMCTMHLICQVGTPPVHNHCELALDHVVNISQYWVQTHLIVIVKAPLMFYEIASSKGSLGAGLCYWSTTNHSVYVYLVLQEASLPNLLTLTKETLRYLALTCRLHLTFRICPPSGYLLRMLAICSVSGGDWAPNVSSRNQKIWYLSSFVYLDIGNFIMVMY